jgi:hypothetical protein
MIRYDERRDHAQSRLHFARSSTCRTAIVRRRRDENESPFKVGTYSAKADKFNRVRVITIVTFAVQGNQNYL